MTEADDRTRRAGGEHARAGAVLHFGAHALLKFGDLAAELEDMVLKLDDPRDRGKADALGR